MVAPISAKFARTTPPAIMSTARRDTKRDAVLATPSFPAAKSRREHRERDDAHDSDGTCHEYA